MWYIIIIIMCACASLTLQHHFTNDVNVCGSTHCGCMVNGSVAMAAFEYYLQLTCIVFLSVCGNFHLAIRSIPFVAHQHIIPKQKKVWVHHFNFPPTRELST